MSPNKVKTAVQWFVCRAQVFAGFSGYSNSIYYIIPLLKKENVHLFCRLGIKYLFDSSENFEYVIVICIFTNPSPMNRMQHRANFKRSLTGLSSEFSFS